MEQFTIILFIAALLCLAVGFYLTYKQVSIRTVSMFEIVLAVCALSAIFKDATIPGDIVYLLAFPLIAEILYAVADLVVIKELK